MVFAEGHVVAGIAREGVQCTLRMQWREREEELVHARRPPLRHILRHNRSRLE